MLQQPIEPAPPDAGVAADAIVDGVHGDPFAVLGPHRAGGGRVVVRSFQPAADQVDLVDAATGCVLARMDRIHPGGLFMAELPSHCPADGYRLRLRHADGRTVEIDDPYRFPSTLGHHGHHLMSEDGHRRLYRTLGAHPATIDGVAGVRFAVWAPNARRVSLVGDFNDWDGRRHVMRRHPRSGVWEMFLPGLTAGHLYKYEIIGADGALLPLKADPVAFAMEQPSGGASVVCDLDGYRWSDHDWMARRAATCGRDAPMTIYEVHAGSWRRDETTGRPLTYRQLADRLIPYVADMGFTHIELLPVSEHPFYGSWGYQPLGLFAPTSRYGTPDDLRHFVDRCHQAGIGVILDWVVSHFPDDAHGLARFDGTHLYEHADPRQGRHADWDTLIYNYGRAEVANYLIANALFWLDEFHIDGLRVDAVASILYLDYSREDGDWVPNAHGGNENLDAVAFLKRLNETVYAHRPDTFTVAEESTAWPMVSRPTYLGGLGFGYKWNMGWMNDTLRYMRHDPVHRKHHHDDLTFGLLYAFSENFVLPLSHDEVVHAKGSLLDRMPGDRWQRFANLRAYLALMAAYPGKKLLFMGGEFGQQREWDHETGLDWHLLDDPPHAGLRALVRDLNRLYRALPALHARDCEADGFRWIDCHDHQQSVIAFLRQGGAPGDLAVVVCNFTPVVRHGYRIGVPRGGRWRERLNTDSTFYGGGDVGNGGLVAAGATPSHGFDHCLELTLPPLGTLVLEPA